MRTTRNLKRTHPFYYVVHNNEIVIIYQYNLYQRQIDRLSNPT